MNEIITIGLDLAKSVFQVHGIAASGETVIRRQLRRRQVHALLQEPAALSGRYRGLRRARDRGAWA